MPPKFKYTKEEITNVALEIVRECGEDALTARSLAKRLCVSVKPIFVQFENMDEVRREVITSANSLYNSYLENDMKDGKYPPYKASGMAYIRFAREEKFLFKLLFMRDRSAESISENRDEIRPILSIIMKNLNISEDEAYLLHLELWIYVHGIATMIASSYLDWNEEFASRALTDAYEGFKQRYAGERNNVCD